MDNKEEDNFKKEGRCTINFLLLIHINTPNIVVDSDPSCLVGGADTKTTSEGVFIIGTANTPALVNSSVGSGIHNIIAILFLLLLLLLFTS